MSEHADTVREPWEIPPHNSNDHRQGPVHNCDRCIMDALVAEIDELRRGLQTRLLTAYENEGVGEVFAFAAGAVEAAEAERDRYKAALEQIEGHVYDGSPKSGKDLRLVARAALSVSGRGAA